MTSDANYCENPFWLNLNLPEKETSVNHIDTTTKNREYEKKSTSGDESIVSNKSSIIQTSKISLYSLIYSLLSIYLWKL